MKNFGTARLVAVAILLNSMLWPLAAHARYWDCTVKMFGPDFYGIRKGIFGGGTFQGEVTVEIEAASRTQAEQKLSQNSISTNKGKVCAVGGIDNNECKLWQAQNPTCTGQ